MGLVLHLLRSTQQFARLILEPAGINISSFMVVVTEKVGRATARRPHGSASVMLVCPSVTETSPVDIVPRWTIAGIDSRSVDGSLGRIA